MLHQAVPSVPNPWNMDRVPTHEYPTRVATLPNTDVCRCSGSADSLACSEFICNFSDNAAGCACVAKNRDSRSIFIRHTPGLQLLLRRKPCANLSADSFSLLMMGNMVNYLWMCDIAYGPTSVKNLEHSQIGFTSRHRNCSRDRGRDQPTLICRTLIILYTLETLLLGGSTGPLKS